MNKIKITILTTIILLPSVVNAEQNKDAIDVIKSINKLVRNNNQEYKYKSILTKEERSSDARGMDNSITISPTTNEPTSNGDNGYFNNYYNNYYNNFYNNNYNNNYNNVYNNNYNNNHHNNNNNNNNNHNNNDNKVNRN